MSQDLAEHVTAELRAEMGRKQVVSLALAKRLQVSDMWVSRRLRGRTRMTIVDLERMTDALGVPVATLLERAIANIDTHTGAGVG